MSSIATYEDQGIVHLRSFLDGEALLAIERELERAEQIAHRDLQERWHGRKLTFYSRNPLRSTDSRQTEDFVVDPYFQESVGACHVFFEEIDGQVVLNRMGHGLHRHPELERIARVVYDNPRLHDFLKAAGYRRPVCLLSVYIPKHPNGFGSEVRPHQESTFAHTQPHSACVLWVALEDATRENACMYGLPKSHALPLKFVSKVDHAQRRREYVRIDDVEIPSFDPNESVYEALEVDASDALLFHGNYVHCSPRNTSTRSRKALSFQFIETDGVTFSPFNWIRTLSERPLYE